MNVRFTIAAICALFFVIVALKGTIDWKGNRGSPSPINDDELQTGNPSRSSLTLLDVRKLFASSMDATSGPLMPVGDNSRCATLTAELLLLHPSSRQHHHHNSPTFYLPLDEVHATRSNHQRCTSKLSNSVVLVVPVAASHAASIDMEAFVTSLVAGMCVANGGVRVVGVLWLPHEGATDHHQNRSSLRAAAEAMLRTKLIPKGDACDATHIGTLSGARLWVGASAPPRSPLELSRLACTIRNQLGRQSAVGRTTTTASDRESVPRGSAFHVAGLAHATIPFYMSADLSWLIVDIIAPRVIRALQVLSNVLNDDDDATLSNAAMRRRPSTSLDEKSSSSFDEVLRLSSHQRRFFSAPPTITAAQLTPGASWTSLATRIGAISPILAACGVPPRFHEAISRLPEHNDVGAANISRLSPPSPSGLLRITEDSLPMAECIALMMSGRDIQRFTFDEWSATTAQSPAPPLPSLSSWTKMDERRTARKSWSASIALRSSKSLRTEDQVPYVYMTGDASFHQALTRESSREGGGGLPWRDDKSGSLAFVPVRRMTLAATHGLNAQQPVSNTEDDEAVIAAVYVPTRIDQFGMRDMVRCYHRSLEPRVRQRVALHFLLGARAAMDARFVFRGRGDVREGEAYFDEASGLTVWHRLALENCSRDFERRGDVGSSSVPASGCPSGDVLLLDVIDLDRAPYTTKSHEKRMQGVTRASLNSPRRRSRPSWHHVSEVSAMLIKLLVGMAHMVQLHPSSQFFVRGADDAYVSFRQVYVDTLAMIQQQALQQHNDTRRGVLERLWYVGHVTLRGMGSRCGACEVSRAGTPLAELMAKKTITSSIRFAGAPAIYPEYVTGGGGAFSAELVRLLVVSFGYAPPLLWVEEDVALGRLIAPLALAYKSKRFHNFFNATEDVDHAFNGKVPRAFEYCNDVSWVVHKYPWRALRFVDNATSAMRCSSAANSGNGGGASSSTHMCWDWLQQQRFRTDAEWPTWALQERYFVASKDALKTSKRSRQENHRGYAADPMGRRYRCNPKDLFADVFQHPQMTASCP